MNWPFHLHETQPVAHAIGVLAFVCLAGMALGSVKVRGLGTAGVLKMDFTTLLRILIAQILTLTLIR